MEHGRYMQTTTTHETNLPSRHTTITKSVVKTRRLILITVLSCFYFRNYYQNFLYGKLNPIKVVVQQTDLLSKLKIYNVCN